ncbi:MAG: sulfur oxidation c-type cytochrome SoxA [Sedimenticola sp.]|nr:sulfur oxidation c-type cytochrome SoxA [Sedimenticola sp.]
MKARLFIAVTALHAIVLPAVAETNFNTHPRFEINPELGVAGDFSGTYKHWRDPSAVEQFASVQTDSSNEWMMNGKNMDIVEDDFHPGHLAVDEGEKLVNLWEHREPGFKACLGSGSTDLEGIAARYPLYDEKLGRVMTLAARVEHCSKKVLWKNFKQGSPMNANITLYLKSLSNGQPIQIAVDSGPMKEAYLRGETLFYKRVGQLNFACASCHTPGSIMGNRLRGEVPSTPFGDVSHYPTYRSPVGEVEVLHKRFMRCLKQMRAKPLKPGDPAYVDLEVFYTSMSNGYPITAPSIR